MIHRRLTPKIEKLLDSFPVVGLLGSRQVGKTTLVKHLNLKGKSTIYLDLENPADLFKLSDPVLYLEKHQNTLIIIDEIQRMPSLFPILRGLVDRHRVPGRFLLLGSASPELIKHASESLAGRIIYQELSPFDRTEVEDTEKLWVRGGYPDSFLAKDNALSFQWREAFIRTYLERDIPQFGIRIPAPQLRRFWTMLAHLHGQLWNASQFAANFGVSAPTVERYLDILEETFMIRRVPPYFSNTKKRLIKSPKIYLQDSGLLHTLLSLDSEEAILSHPIQGTSWEGFVLEQIIRQLPNTWQYSFYRTSTGNEIDLILQKPDGKRYAIEVKRSLHPHLTKGFWIALEDLRCEKTYVIYSGKESFFLKASVEVLPVANIETIFS